MPPADASAAARVRIPAKLNLHLGVGPLRSDGYHELITVFHAIGVYDQVSVRPAPALRVRLRGLGAAELPDGPDNLAWRAAALLAERAHRPAAVLIEIDKAIPVAGGMAGGSADAAATLLACAALWQTGTPDDQLHELAAQLGSDVAFMLAGGTALGTGRGERLTPVASTGSLHWVIAVAPFGISAAAAYRELDRLRAAGQAPPPAGPPDALLEALSRGDPEGVGAALTNDLQAAALSLEPALQRTLDTGLGLGVLGGMVSGSGPSCAFLCPNADEAQRVAAGLRASGACRTSCIAVGPAHPLLDR